MTFLYQDVCHVTSLLAWGGGESSGSKSPEQHLLFETRATASGAMSMNFHRKRQPFIDENLAYMENLVYKENLAYKENPLFPYTLNITSW